MKNTPHVHTDFETFSVIDLTAVGAYKYAEHESTEPLCLGFAIEKQKVRSWVPERRANGRMKSAVCPTPIVQAIEEGYFFVAHNAQFERAIWHYIMHLRWGWPDVPPKKWICTAAMSAAVGFPRSLDGATRRAKLPEEFLKDKEGAALLKLFA